jgi:hypothetical protein
LAACRESASTTGLDGVFSTVSSLMADLTSGWEAACLGELAT